MMCSHHVAKFAIEFLSILIPNYPVELKKLRPAWRPSLSYLQFKQTRTNFRKVKVLNTCISLVKQ